MPLGVSGFRYPVAFCFRGIDDDDGSEPVEGDTDEEYVQKEEPRKDLTNVLRGKGPIGCYGGSEKGGRSILPSLSFPFLLLYLYIHI